jgi:hypothetical protein
VANLPEDHCQAVKGLSATGAYPKPQAKTGDGDNGACALERRQRAGVFYPEEVEILTAAFDDAWAGLQASQAPFTEEAYSPATREIKHNSTAFPGGCRGLRLPKGEGGGMGGGIDQSPQ